MTKEVSSQVQSKKKESTTSKKESKESKESDSSEEDNDNDVAYLSPVWNKHSTAP